MFIKKVILFLNCYKKILIPAAGLLLVAVLVLTVVFSSNSARMKSALDPNNKEYERVQIALQMEMTDLSPETSSEEESTQSEPDFSQNGYYDQNGSFIAESAEETTSDEPDNTVEFGIQIKKDGQVYSEKNKNSDERERYYYKRDGKNYVLYYDNYYGMKMDDGDWTEVAAENYSLPKSFDISILKSIDLKKMHKSGDVYVPDDDYAETLFYNLLQLSETNREKYLVTSISLSLEKNRIRNISASYVIGSEYQVEQTYTFTYNNTAIEVPQVDKVYGED